ncbi:MAG: hypothetical protein IPK94_07215 [Saprospiraceae bacterium]|nr:hypothetical protein [Saprospiraceae bacterium]
MAIFDWCTQAEEDLCTYISIEDKIAPIPTNQNLGMVASGARMTVANILI